MIQRHPIRSLVLFIATGVLLVSLVFQADSAGAGANGDVDGNGDIGLADTILALQICAETPTPSSINTAEADINGDGRIGSEEVIYTLQVLSSLRPSPFADWDQDAYSVSNGDCNDYHYEIYPGAPDSCGDGVDQDCDGLDLPCPAVATYAEENFALNAGGFRESTRFIHSSSTGRLIFEGHGTDSGYLIAWNGGSNPSPYWYPLVSHSNYFNDFNVSVDTFWDGESENYSWGLLINMGRGNTGGVDSIGFLITKAGYYLIDKTIDGVWEPLVYWNRSFLRAPGGQGNTIAIEKEGNNYRFYLNGTEIERMTIEGFTGGGIGLFVGDKTDVSFDNFRITDPLKPSPAGRDFPHVTTADENKYVYEAMTRSYYWYKDVPQVDPTTYPSPYALLAALTSPLDMGSFVVPQWVFDDYFIRGTYLGLGLDWDYDQNNDFRITYVYPGSPADLLGLVRGDKVLEIDGHAVEGMDENDLYGLISTLLGEAKDGDYLDGKIETAAGAVRDVQLLLTEVAIKPVLHHEIIEHGGKKIGYLVFQNFIEPALAALTTMFAEFSEEDIDELILDLRYNSGGYTYVANALATSIIGNQAVGEVFLRYQYNDKFTDWDEYELFASQTSMLGLDRLLVITTPSTCSASEVIINSLRPFIDVTTVGSVTCGKPMGMNGYDFYDLHIRPIEFKSVNARSEGDYFDGMQPTCAAIDDLTRNFGDTEEDSLAEALNYISTGVCSPTRAKPRSKIRQKTLPVEGFRRELGAF